MVVTYDGLGFLDKMYLAYRTIVEYAEIYNSIMPYFTSMHTTHMESW